MTIDALAQSAADALGRRVGALLASFDLDASRALRTLLHAALLGVCFEERALRECCQGPVDDVIDRALLLGILRVHQPGVYRFEHQIYAEQLLERLRDALRDRADIQRTTARVIGSLYGRVRPDITAAPHLFRAAGDFDAAYQSADWVVRSLAICHMFTEAEAMIAIIGRWADEDARASRPMQARPIYFLACGRLTYHKLDHPAAIESLTNARDAFARTGDAEMADEAARSLATAYFFADQPRRAEEIIRELLPRVTKPHSLAMIHHHLAEIAQLRGDITSAIEHERTALAHDPGEFICTGTLAALLFVRGDLDEATRTYDAFKLNPAPGRSSRRAATLGMAIASLGAIALCVQSGDFGRADARCPSSRTGRWERRTFVTRGRSRLASVPTAPCALPPIEPADDGPRMRRRGDEQRTAPFHMTSSRRGGRSARPKRTCAARGMTTMADDLGAMLTSRQAKLDV